MEFAELSGMSAEFSQPKANYMRGWGLDGHGAKEFMEAWYLIIKEMDGNPTALMLDVKNDKFVNGHKKICRDS